MSHQTSKHFVYHNIVLTLFLNDYVTITCIHTGQFIYYIILTPSSHTHIQAHNEQFSYWESSTQIIILILGIKQQLTHLILWIKQQASILILRFKHSISIQHNNIYVYITIYFAIIYNEFEECPVIITNTEFLMVLLQCTVYQRHTYCPNDMLL